MAGEYHLEERTHEEIVVDEIQTNRRMGQSILDAIAMLRARVTRLEESFKNDMQAILEAISSRAADECLEDTIHDFGPARRLAELREVERDIIATLRAAGSRLSRKSIMASLSHAHHPHGETTVRMALDRLRAAGFVDLDCRSNPRGFAVTAACPVK